MKKYLFVFSLLASLATVACDTSSKASTTQTLAATQPVPAPVAAAPVAIDSAMTPMQMKKAFVKKRNTDLMQQAPMTQEERRKMLQPPPPEAPTKKQ